MNKAIITPAESDVYLAAYLDWIALDDTTKTLHIEKASVYVQTQWVCVDVDWDDDLTIPDNVKEATAYYAYADFQGTLYGDPGDPTQPGQLSGKLVTAGSVTVSKSYFKGSNSIYGSASPFGYPDTLMAVSCESATANSSTDELIRD